MRRLFPPLLLLLLLAATGCSSSSGAFPPDAIVVPASSDLGVGQERFLVGVSRPDATRLGAPDEPVRLLVEHLDGGGEQEVDATFTWIIPDVIGLYRANVTFDRAGPWQVSVIPEDGDPIGPSPFNVFEESSTPAVGTVAPVVDTPTLADHTIAELTTDPDPDERFYELSLREAVASGRPTVLVFSTPAYCTTASCGPMLGNVKGIIDGYPDVNFIHVEVYTGLTDPDFVPDEAHLAPAAVAWRLPSEPWVFLIDGDGMVAARFEGVLDPAELSALLG